MSERRKKTDSILVRRGGKSRLLELFPAEEWPEQSPGDGLFRVRLDARWHSPMGPFSFLTLPAIGELVATLLSGGEPQEPEHAPEWMRKGAEVRVYYGMDGEGLPRRYHAYIDDAPQLGPDGRQYVLCHCYGLGKRFVPAADVELSPRFALFPGQKTNEKANGSCLAKKAKRRKGHARQA